MTVVDPSVALAAVVTYGDQRAAEQQRVDADALTAARAAYAALGVLHVNLQADFAAYKVAHPDDEPPPPPPVERRTIIGMSSPANIWDQRVSEVGDGLTARRIFADLAQGPGDQMDLIRAAHAAGMMPVVSYKCGGDGAGAASGRFDSAAQGAAQLLAAFDMPTTVTIWHEPHGDLTAAQFVAAQARLTPIFKRGQISVGPFLNGWLLDRQVDTFTSYTSPDLLDAWDFIGIDTYEAGTIESPGVTKPADRLPKLLAWLDAQDRPDMLIGVGEYNGYSAATIRAAGEGFLSTPQVWFACMWNSTTGKGHTLTGDRLAAFKATLADPRVRK